MTAAPPPSIPPSIPPRNRTNAGTASGTVTAVPGRGGAGRTNGHAPGAVPEPAVEEPQAPVAPSFPEPPPARSLHEPADEDEDLGPSPLATAVDRTGQWLRKAATATGSGMTAAYSSLTRPRPKEDPMTANPDAPSVPGRPVTPVTAPAIGAPIPGGALPAGGLPGAAPRPQTGRTPMVGGAGPRRVRLAISRIDPWSVMKLSFLLSFAAGLMLVVAIAVLWLTLDGLHVFTNVDTLVRDIVGQESPINVLQYVEFSKVISAATLVAVIDVFLLTALGTIGAFLYNVVAALVGGVHVTMTDE